MAPGLTQEGQKMARLVSGMAQNRKANSEFRISLNKKEIKRK